MLKNSEQIILVAFRLLMIWARTEGGMYHKKQSKSDKLFGLVDTDWCRSARLHPLGQVAHRFALDVVPLLPPPPPSSILPRLDLQRLKRRSR